MIDPLEPNGHGPEPGPVSTARVATYRPWRLGLALVAALALIVGAVAVLPAALAGTGGGANPAGPAGPNAAPTSSPAPSSGPGRAQRPGAAPRFGPGPFAGFGPSGPLARAIGGRGAGGVTITAISGSSLSLRTVDGWTRTITVTGATKITRAGATIGIGQLRVGDTIAFQERRASDGTYTITAIRVILPTTAGQVTAKGTATITIKRADGTSQTIRVTDATTYRVGGVAHPSLADVAVGMRLVAQGTANADGSFTATSVAAASSPTRPAPNTTAPRPPRGPRGNAPGATPRPSMPPLSNS